MNNAGQVSCRGNRQGFLDSLNHPQCGQQHLAAQALAADREDVKEQKAAEKKLAGLREQKAGYWKESGV